MDIIKPPAKKPDLPKLEPAAASDPNLEQISLDDTQPTPNTKPSMSSWLRWLLIGLGALLLLIALASLWVMFQLQPKAAEGHARQVIIESGQTPESIAQELADEGIIKNALVFNWYAKWKGVENQLQAGAYALSPTQPASEVLEYLVDGRINAINVTIPPGLTLKELSQRLKNEYGFLEADIEAALGMDYQHPLLANKPASATLEGYIYPETFEVMPGEGPAPLFRRSFDEFWRVLKENNTVALLKKQGLNLHQGLTLASIVQAEVSNPDDQRQVAQVFLKRLRIDMQLGSDVTARYGAALDNLSLPADPAAADAMAITHDSPYNTRIHTGLPPGPIESFNFSALEAVAKPASGDYLYFVAGGGQFIGKTYFAHTHDEHLQNVANYCQELCQ